MNGFLTTVGTDFGSTVEAQAVASYPFTGLRTKEALMNGKSLLHGELSHAIIGCAMTILNELKPGLDEKAYENALVFELGKRGLQVNQQKRFEVRYQGVLIDMLVPDLIVNDLIIVDPKVVEVFMPTHIAQMTGYLAITKLRLALLINFKHADLRWKRIIR